MQRQAHLRRLHFASVVIFSILTLAGAAYVIYDILRLTLSTTGLGPAFFIIVLGSTVLLVRLSTRHYMKLLHVLNLCIPLSLACLADKGLLLHRSSWR
jgi:hypothetical protein